MLFRLTALFLFVMTGTAFASCEWAEQAERSGKINVAFMQYIYCAEEENDPEAQYKLGVMFYQGKGLKRPDFRRAVAFFSRSANNGYAPAQTKLGLLYWRGEGVSKNMKMAHKWLYLAQEPELLRWFYYYGPSSDPTAASLYSRLNNVIKIEDDAFAAIPFSSSIQLSSFGENVIPSYKEVSEFQHEKLVEAGDIFLDDRGQQDLAGFLNNLQPNVNPRFPNTLRDDEKQVVMQTILNWFKPVLLTAQNFDASKAPVLEKLKKEIETPEQ